MRRWMGRALLIAAVAGWGCTENSTPDGEDPGAGGGGGFPAPGLGTFPEGGDGPTPPPPNPFNDFGGECSPPDGCNNEAEDWPDCLNLGCSTGDCTYPGLADDYGYCTRECTSDEQCGNAVANGPYGTEFRCMTDGTSGTCVPGSATRCDRLANGQCDDPDEVCKWGVIYAPDNTYGGTCQPPTADGRAVGEACDEEQALYCANDLCLFDTCTTLCDPNADPANSPCPNGWSCFDEFDIGVTLDVCLPSYCEVNADCPNGFTCALAFEFNSETVLRGICLATDPGSAQPGEACGEERSCQGATCFEGEGGADGFCSGMCNNDADCGPGAYCDIVNFGIDAEPGSAPAQICRQGERTGSGRACSTDLDCGADGEFPEEACDYYITGQLDAGRYTDGPRLAGRCAEIAGNAVDFGAACGDLNGPCRTEGLCLNGGNGSFCSAACRDTRDCADGALCFAIDFGGQSGGVCIPGAIFGVDGSSFDNCGNDGDCGEGEVCQLNLIESSEPVAELLCFATGGAQAGADCTDGGDCRSGFCGLRSTDPTVPGFCQAPCRADDDCGVGYTCEQVSPAAGSNRVRMCRPTETCAPCAFDGSAPCGGDRVCSLLSYSSGEGAACLPPCNGLNDVDCPDGYACQEAINGRGEATGEFACTPFQPELICNAAQPR